MADVSSAFQITHTGRRPHEFWTDEPRILDAEEFTDIGRRARVRARYWAVEVEDPSVLEGASGATGEASLVDGSNSMPAAM